MKHKRKEWSWIAYDWANSAFSTTVIAGFFPLFFKQYWAESLTPVESSQMLALGNGVIAIIVAITCFCIGFLSNRYSMSQKAFRILVILGVFSCSCLSIINQNNWLIALFVLGITHMAFSGANTLYDGMLVSLFKKKTVSDCLYLAMLGDILAADFYSY